MDEQREQYYIIARNYGCLDFGEGSRLNCSQLNNNGQRVFTLAEESFWRNGYTGQLVAADAARSVIQIYSNDTIHHYLPEDISVNGNHAAYREFKGICTKEPFFGDLVQTLRTGEDDFFPLLTKPQVTNAINMMTTMNNVSNRSGAEMLAILFETALESGAKNADKLFNIATDCDDNQIAYLAMQPGMSRLLEICSDVSSLVDDEFHESGEDMYQMFKDNFAEEMDEIKTILNEITPYDTLAKTKPSMHP